MLHFDIFYKKWLEKPSLNNFIPVFSRNITRSFECTTDVGCYEFEEGYDVFITFDTTRGYDFYNFLISSDEIISDAYATTLRELTNHSLSSESAVRWWAINVLVPIFGSGIGAVIVAWLLSEM